MTARFPRAVFFRALRISPREIHLPALPKGSRESLFFSGKVSRKEFPVAGFKVCLADTRRQDQECLAPGGTFLI